jgi:hypothetical protein
VVGVLDAVDGDTLAAALGFGGGGRPLSVRPPPPKGTNDGFAASADAAGALLEPLGPFSGTSVGGLNASGAN